MLHTYSRAMNETERTTLADQLLYLTNSSYSPWDRLRDGFLTGSGYALCGLLLALFLAGFLAIWDISSTWLIGIGIGFGLIGFGFGFSIGTRNARQDEYRRKQYAASLANCWIQGEVEVTTVVSSDVLAVDCDWECPTLFFDIGTSRVLHLNGDYTTELLVFENYENDTDPPGVYSAFDIVRYPGLDDDLTYIEPHGPAIPLTKMLYWQETEGVCTVFEDREVFTGVSLTTLDQDFPDVLKKEDLPW